MISANNIYPYDHFYPIGPEHNYISFGRAKNDRDIEISSIARKAALDKVTAYNLSLKGRKVKVFSDCVQTLEYTQYKRGFLQECLRVFDTISSFIMINIVIMFLFIIIIHFAKELALRILHSQTYRWDEEPIALAIGRFIYMSMMFCVLVAAELSIHRESWRYIKVVKLKDVELVKISDKLQNGIEDGGYIDPISFEPLDLDQARTLQCGSFAIDVKNALRSILERKFPEEPGLISHPIEARNMTEGEEKQFLDQLSSLLSIDAKRLRDCWIVGEYQLEHRTTKFFVDLVALMHPITVSRVLYTYHIKSHVKKELRKYIPAEEFSKLVNNESIFKYSGDEITALGRTILPYIRLI